MIKKRIKFQGNFESSTLHIHSMKGRGLTFDNFEEKLLDVGDCLAIDSLKSLGEGGLGDVVLHGGGASLIKTQQRVKSQGIQSWEELKPKGRVLA